MTVCTVDQPKDGLAAAPPQNACPRADRDSRRAARVQPRRLPQRDRRAHLERPRTDPDAHAELPHREPGRRTRARGSSSSLSRYISRPAPTRCAGTARSRHPGPTQCAGRPTTADGQGEAQGDATGGNVDWTIVWDIGTYGSAGEFVYDGTYTVTAQAFDAHGVAGESRLAAVLLNRARALCADRSQRRPQQPFRRQRDCRAEVEHQSGARRARLSGVPAAGDRGAGARLSRERAGGAQGHDVHGSRSARAGEVTYLVYAVDREDLASSRQSAARGRPRNDHRVVCRPGATVPDAQPSIVDTDPVVRPAAAAVDAAGRRSARPLLPDLQGHGHRPR